MKPFHLWGHFKAYASHSRNVPKYTGIVGAVAFPLFYLLHELRGTHDYDSAMLRGGAAVMCLLVALRDHWPKRLRPHYIALTYLTYLYCLPFLWVFMALKNNGGSVSVANTFMAVFFLVLLTDWRNTVAMLLAGTGLAAAIYIVSTPNPIMPVDYIGRLPTLILVVVGGSVFKFSEKQIQAERLDAATALAGSIAHEMRNPLGQIKHNLESMQQALPAPTIATQAQKLAAPQVDALYRHLAESELAVKRGLQVIAMTLDEVSAKPMDVNAFSYLSAAETTHQAVQEYAFQSEAERARVGVHVTQDFSFRGDETAYLFVLFNLIKNALYYLSQYPQARVDITVGQHQVKVRDSGPGIAPDVLSGLFEPFRSVGKSGGTGLGLAYCQRVMRGFGGEIRCQSVLGQYTEFTMQFPPTTEQERQLHHDAVLQTAATSLSGKRLLLVEDDAAQRMTTRHKLRPLDLVVDEAADGQRALDLLARQAYDLVLLDLNMPVLDGYGLAEKIRQGQVPLNRLVRIVAHSSEPAHLARVKTQRAGMDGFVSKPSAQLQLAAALQQALQRTPALADPALAGRRVVLADDNVYNRRAVAAYLERAGATVVEVGDGQAVLARLAGGERVDAVLMDLNMPGMDGLKAAQAIRNSSQPWHGIPIVALTAHSDEHAVRVAHEAGMDGFLVKPVEAELLYSTLRSLLAPRPAAMPGAPATATTAVTAKQLLNLDRLQSYDRLGLLDELLGDYLPEIHRLVAALDGAIAEQDLPQARETLHSLLGMSGEAGALALHQMVQRIYVTVLEHGRWPPEAGWLTQVKSVAGQTEQALQQYATVHRPHRAT